METASMWQLINASLTFGAGLLIAGMLGCIFYYRQRQHQSFDGWRRRLEIFEGIAADVGNVSHIFSKYSALTVESIRFGKQWPPSRSRELEVVSTKLAEEFAKLSSAEANLLMLGEKVLEKNLRLYGSKIAAFRRQVYVGRTDITEDDILSMKREIALLREQFYDFLSKKYDRLLAA